MMGDGVWRRSGGDGLGGDGECRHWILPGVGCDLASAYLEV
jgi:hypothetical protein